MLEGQIVPAEQDNGAVEKLKALMMGIIVSCAQKKVTSRNPNMNWILGDVAKGYQHIQQIGAPIDLGAILAQAGLTQQPAAPPVEVQQDTSLADAITSLAVTQKDILKQLKALKK